MSVPPEFISQLAGRGPQAPPMTPGGAGPTMGAGAQRQPAPAAAPMAKPQQKEGLKAAAQTNVHIAANMLEEALGAFGSESPEGESILNALRSIRKIVAKRDSSDLVPAELLHMVSQMSQAGGGTDIQRMIRQQMMQPQRPQVPPTAPPMPSQGV